jgi:hypothetical protein
MRPFAAGVSWPLRFPRKAKVDFMDCQVPIGFARAWMAPSVETRSWAAPVSVTWPLVGARDRNCENNFRWISDSGTLRGEGKRGRVEVKL